MLRRLNTLFSTAPSSFHCTLYFPATCFGKCMWSSSSIRHEWNLSSVLGTIALVHYSAMGDTAQSSPVQSSPVRLSKTRSDSVAHLQWPSRQCVHTSRVESSTVQSHESCWVKSLHAAYFIFVSQTPVIGRDGRNGCREACSLDEGLRGNLRRIALWTPGPRLTLMMMMIITTKT
jgi:hypothetical protein